MDRTDFYCSKYLEFKRLIKRKDWKNLANEIDILFQDIQHILEGVCCNNCSGCEWNYLCDTPE